MIHNDLRGTGASRSYPRDPMGFFNLASAYFLTVKTYLAKNFPPPSVKIEICLTEGAHALQRPREVPWGAFFRDSQKSWIDLLAVGITVSRYSS